MFDNNNVNLVYLKMHTPMYTNSYIKMESYNKRSFSNIPFFFTKKIKSLLFIYIQSYKYILLKLHYLFLKSLYDAI